MENTSTELMTSIDFSVGPPNTGQIDARHLKALLSEIESREFSVQLGIASTLGQFILAATEESAVISLYKAIQSSNQALQSVFEELNKLALLPVDEQYENPYDTALAVLLWLVYQSLESHALWAADLVARTPACWNAHRLAKYILLNGNHFTATSDSSWLGFLTPPSIQLGTISERLITNWAVEIAPFLYAGVNKSQQARLGDSPISQLQVA